MTVFTLLIWCSLIRPFSLPYNNTLHKKFKVNYKGAIMANDGVFFKLKGRTRKDSSYVKRGCCCYFAPLHSGIFTTLFIIIFLCFLQFERRSNISVGQSARRLFGHIRGAFGK